MLHRLVQVVRVGVKRGPAGRLTGRAVLAVIAIEADLTDDVSTEQPLNAARIGALAAAAVAGDANQQGLATLAQSLLELAGTGNGLRTRRGRGGHVEHLIKRTRMGWWLRWVILPVGQPLSNRDQAPGCPIAPRRLALPGNKGAFDGD
jgi:hypothetical protein